MPEETILGVISDWCCLQGTNAENALGLSRAVLEEALKARRELVLNEASSVGAMQDEIHQVSHATKAMMGADDTTSAREPRPRARCLTGVAPPLF